jgi:hypothetical protein
MNISTLAVFGVAGTIALLSVSQPIAEGATAASSALPAKAKAPMRVRAVQVEAAPAAPSAAGSAQRVIGPSVAGPSTAGSAPGPGFGIIAAPYGAAASSPPPLDAGAPPDPKR